MNAATRAPAVHRDRRPRTAPKRLHRAVLQRCGSAPCPPSGCADHESERSILRRFETGSGPSTAPAIIEEVLRSPGEALRSDVRERFESRLGHDFSRVRVHADDHSAASARAVDAFAYTVGDHIVFGSGGYAPDTAAGRSVLAHELVHVMQQRSATPAAPGSLAIGEPHAAAEIEARREAAQAVATPFGDSRLLDLRHDSLPHVAVQRAGPTTVTTTTTGATCSPAQGETIRRAGIQALSWLDQAGAKLDRLAGAPADPANASLAAVFNRHFHSLDPAVVQQVRGRVRSIRADVAGAVQFSVECHAPTDPECRTAGAYVSNERDRVVFCPGYFSGAERFRTEAIVHEMAHAQLSGEPITDRGYETERLRPMLSTEQALTNAESFGLLVEELATGRAPAAPPVDVKRNCPAGWQGPISRGMARAQRWNRDADVSLSSLTPATATGWSAQRLQWLGGSTQAAIDAAKAAFARLETALAGPVDLTCETKGGGACDRFSVHWTPGHSLHICPSWLTRAPDDQVEVLLTGLFGFLGGVANDVRRLGYARLSKDMSQEASTPTRQRVLGSRAWTRDQISIWFVPTVPRGYRHHYIESLTQQERLSPEVPVHQATGPLVFEAGVSFTVDSYGLERPAPFTAPRVSVDFALPDRNGTRRVHHDDARPVHEPASDLKTRFPQTFRFELAAGGPLRMTFRLEDPDTALKLVYDDTIEMRQDPMRTPGDFPQPTETTKARA